MNTRYKLMVPGPVELEQNVLDAMGEPIRVDYGSEWVMIHADIIRMLKTLFGTQGDVFLLVGSGSAGIDACIGSVVARGEKIIVGNNGFFGERLAAIAKSHGQNVIVVSRESGQPLRAADFESALRRHRNVRAVSVVHLETSTTVINPVSEIGILTRRYGVPLIVDAVSSLGGIDVEMDSWNIDFCISASQKCLGSPPGLAPVAVGPLGWEALNRGPNKNRGWYLDLDTWRHYAKEWSDWHPFPITMATCNALALQVSLNNLMADGKKTRFEYYQRLALRLRNGLREIGILPFTPDHMLAPVVTAALTPTGTRSSDIVQYVADNASIRIAGGVGDQLKNKIIRVGHMGPTITYGDIDRLLSSLRDFMLVRGLAR